MTARYEQEEEGLTNKVSLPKKFAQITRNLQLQQILHFQVSHNTFLKTPYTACYDDCGAVHQKQLTRPHVHYNLVKIEAYLPKIKII